ncbi:MAG: extracellular solute-binding protein [Firmicutes bacterium]|nr:extracellular solute-binding protein [Bacillota bacterium]
MRKLSRNILSMAVMFAIALVMLSGCGKNTAVTSNEKNGKPVLKALINYMREDPNTYPAVKDLEEKTGYIVRYDMLPQDNPEEKLNLIIASNEDYDMIICTNSQKARWAEYARQGALFPLDEWIAQYGENMRNVIKGSSFDLMKIDDKIYGIPTLGAAGGNDVGSFSSMLAVRGDWMDLAGTAQPQTLEEFTNLLQILKDKDFGSNKESNIPLVPSNVAEIVGVIGAFGVPNAWNEVDGALLNRAEDLRYVEYLKYIAHLYEKGLIDREFATNKPATIKEKFTSGKAGMMSLAYYDVASITDALAKNVPNSSIRFLNPPIGKDGMRGIGESPNILDRFTFIPKSSKNPVETMKYIDLKLEQDTFRLLAIGEEGKHYTIEDGQYIPIDPTFYDERSYSNNFLTGQDDEMYPIYWQARVRKDQRIYDAFMYMRDDERSKFIVTNPIRNAPSLQNEKHIQVLNQMLSDFSMKIVVGASSVSEYDNFLKKWREEGGEELTKEVNEWYRINK